MAKKKKSKPKSADTKEEPAFEESLAELESIVVDLESGELGLEEALERYEVGIRRLKQCHAQLAKASRKIELLSGFDASGNPITERWDDEHASLEEKQASRSAKKSAKKSGAEGGNRLF